MPKTHFVMVPFILGESPLLIGKRADVVQGFVEFENNLVDPQEKTAVAGIISTTVNSRAGGGTASVLVHAILDAIIERYPDRRMAIFLGSDKVEYVPEKKKADDWNWKPIEPTEKRREGQS